MAEHVTQIQLTNGGAFASPEVTRFMDAMAARLGRTAGEIRSPDLRDVEQAFNLLVASKERFGVQTVRRHVCRHDEGVGDCSGAVTVTA